MHLASTSLCNSDIHNLLYAVDDLYEFCCVDEQKQGPIAHYSGHGWWAWLQWPTNIQAVKLAYWSQFRQIRQNQCAHSGALDSVILCPLRQQWWQQPIALPLAHACRVIKSLYSVENENITCTMYVRNRNQMTLQHTENPDLLWIFTPQASSLPCEFTHCW